MSSTEAAAEGGANGSSGQDGDVGDPQSTGALARAMRTQCAQLVGHLLVLLRNLLEACQGALRERGSLPGESSHPLLCSCHSDGLGCAGWTACKADKWFRFEYQQEYLPDWSHVFVDDCCNRVTPVILTDCRAFSDPLLSTVASAANGDLFDCLRGQGCLLPPDLHDAIRRYSGCHLSSTAAQLPGPSFSVAMTATFRSSTVCKLVLFGLCLNLSLVVVPFHFRLCCD